MGGIWCALCMISKQQFSMPLILLSRAGIVFKLNVEVPTP
jgi:hypothetical protein